MDTRSSSGVTAHSIDHEPPMAGTAGPVLPFVGREQLLRAVERAYAHVYDGGRALVAIAGERGSGRSRMLQEIARMPELAGATILEARAGGWSRSTVGFAISQSLREMVVVRRALGPIHAEASNARLDSIATALSTLGTITPLVILIDDIDEDPQAGAALGELLSEVEAPWLVVVTCEPSGLSAATLAGRTGDARIVELRCDRFAHLQVSALLRAILGEDPAPRDVAWLVQRTAGLPLLLREAIEAAIRARALVNDGTGIKRVDAIERAGSELSKLLPLVVPDLRGLDDGERSALASIALLGDRVPHELVAELSIADAAVRALIARRLVASSDEAISIPHRLIYVAALEEAERLRIAERHAEALGRLVLSALDGSIRPPSVTIDTLVRMAPDDAARRSLIESVIEGACRLGYRSDYDTAVRLFDVCYDMGIALCDDPLREARWFERYAISLYALGQVDDHRQLIEDFLGRHDPASAPREIIPTIVRAMIWRAEYFERRKKIAAALELLDRARRLIDTIDDPAEADALRNRALLGIARVHSITDRRAEALAILGDLLERVDPDEQQSVAYDAVLIFARTSQTEEQTRAAERHIDAMLARFDREGKERLALQLRATRLGLRIGVGDYDEVEPEVRSLLEQMRRWSLPRTESNAWVWLAMILTERGETAEALQSIDCAIELRWRVGSIGLWQLAMITRAQILVRARRDDEALATIAYIEYDAQTYDRPCRRFLLEAARTLVQVRRGDLHDCPARLEELERIGTAEGFDGTSSMLLEVEGEMLLHAFSIDRERSRDYARRVLENPPDSLSGRRIYAVALAVLVRAHEAATAASRGKSGSSDPMIRELRRLVGEALTHWIERRAPGNVSHTLSLLRAHAPRAFTSDRLAPMEARLPSELEAPSWHHCDVQTFGSVRVLDASGAERGGRHFGQHKTDSKPKKLLAALSVAAILGRRLKRERIIDMVWGESVTPETAANNFHVTLSGLRQVVGDVVDFDGISYMLNTSLVRVDAIRLVGLVDEAQRYQREGLLFRAYELLREATSLVHGEFLEGIFEEWTDGARELLRARIRTARLRAAEIALSRGELDIVREMVGDLLDADSFDEEAEYLQISLLRAEGERLRALREYDSFAERLVAEYGTEPSLRLRTLRSSIQSDR